MVASLSFLAQPLKATLQIQSPVSLLTTQSNTHAKYNKPVLEEMMLLESKSSFFTRVSGSIFSPENTPEDDKSQSLCKRNIKAGISTYTTRQHLFKKT